MPLLIDQPVSVSVGRSSGRRPSAGGRRATTVALTGAPMRLVCPQQATSRATPAGSVGHGARASSAANSDPASSNAPAMSAAGDAPDMTVVRPHPTSPSTHTPMVGCFTTDAR